MQVGRWARRAAIAATLATTVAAAGYAGWQEMRTSRLQARLLSGVAQSMTVSLREGPNPQARIPTMGRTTSGSATPPCPVSSTR